MDASEKGDCNSLLFPIKDMLLNSETEKNRRDQIQTHHFIVIAAIYHMSIYIYQTSTLSKNENTAKNCYSILVFRKEIIKDSIVRY